MKTAIKFRSLCHAYQSIWQFDLGDDRSVNLASGTDFTIASSTCTAQKSLNPRVRHAV